MTGISSMEFSGWSRTFCFLAFSRPHRALDAHRAAIDYVHFQLVTFQQLHSYQCEVLAAVNFHAPRSPLPDNCGAIEIEHFFTSIRQNRATPSKACAL